MSIDVSVAESIMSIRFDRLEKKNAITAAMYQTMADALLAAEADAAVRVVLFEGSPAIFTAGNDLEDFMKNPPSGAQLQAVEAQMAAEGAHFRELLASPEAKAAFTAFLERRKPDFSTFS